MGVMSKIHLSIPVEEILGMVVVDQNQSCSLFFAQMLEAVIHARVRFLWYLAQEPRAEELLVKNDETEYHLDG